MPLFSFSGTLRLAASKLKCYAHFLSCNGGDCCGGEWFPADSECTQSSCPDGQIYLRWGQYDECCGCLPELVPDPRVGGEFPRPATGQSNPCDIADDLCCPGPTLVPYEPVMQSIGDEILQVGVLYTGCMGRCCRDGICTDEYQVTCEETGGVWHPGQCLGCGCPADCCDEDSAGNVTCETIDCGEACVAPRTLADPDCATGCLGQCCIDGEPQGMMTQAACEAMDGLWQGLGVEECGPCPCRAPYDCDCCESVTSTAAGITFFQPRKKRQPQFTDTFRVTVTGRTESSIYVHGVPVGASCDFEVTFLLCGESFNIEPAECDTNFKKLDVKVCWQEEHTSGETLHIRGCEHGTIDAGSCRPDGCNGSGDCIDGSVCTTTLLHDAAGAEADANIRVNGRLTIDSSGTGPLVLTGDLTIPATACSLTIVVTGTNDDLNRLDGDILQADSSKLVIVEKRGVGTWGIAGQNTYTGQLKVLSGTLVVLADVDGSTGSPSPFGTTSTYSPVVGDAAAMSGVAALLLADDVSVNRTVLISSQASGSSQVVILGGYGSGASTFNSSFSLPRDVTLQAATGGTVTFNGLWFASGSPKITIGSNGNAGTVVINDTLPDGSLDVVLGTLRANATDIVSHTVPVMVGSTLGAATIDQYGKSLTLDSLTFTGDTGLVTNGTLRPTAVDADGTGHEIASAVSLNHDATFTVQAASDLKVSGVISGAYAVTKEGGGLLLLSAANTYSGDTTINGGTAKAGNAAAFGTGTITVNAGGTLDKNGFTLANTIVNNGGTVIP